MRSRERRFVGRAREWQITCPKCQAISKVIKSGAGHSMAPKGIVKKLTQAGWQVGDNPKQDLCPDCIRKPIKSHIKTADKALNDLQAPIVPINGTKQVHFADLKVAAATLTAECAKELIALLRQQIPAKAPKAPKAEPPPKMEQSDYENWLNELK